MVLDFNLLCLLMYLVILQSLLIWLHFSVRQDIISESDCKFVFLQFIKKSAVMQNIDDCFSKFNLNTNAMLDETNES